MSRTQIKCLCGTSLVAIIVIIVPCLYYLDIHMYILSHHRALKPYIAYITGTSVSSSPRPLLLDPTDQLMYEYQLRIHNKTTKNVFAFSLNDSSVTHTILWFNMPFWISLEKVNQYAKTCFYKNCEFTKDSSLLKQSSAVIFCVTCGGFQSMPPLQPFERPGNQVWIYFGVESPQCRAKLHKNQEPVWKNSMNWSMNFRMDSEVIFPYGYLKTRESLPERNYSDIYRQKTKFAAWIVSNCKAYSKRDLFIQRLQEHGVPVDVYGRCGKHRICDAAELINKDYKFFLSFENSFCTDYITEKFFQYYSSDTLLVVRGGADYNKLLPKESYINTADFDTFKELADYLKHVNSSEKLYIEHLKRKDRYSATCDKAGSDIAYCSLCAKLNNLLDNINMYESVPTKLETCNIPGDIERMEHNEMKRRRK